MGGIDVPASIDPHILVSVLCGFDTAASDFRKASLVIRRHC